MSHSLTLSESSTPRVGRGRVQLLLILAVVIGPMLLEVASTIRRLLPVPGLM